MPIFVYKVSINNDKINVGVMAENSTVARDGLTQKYGNSPASFLCRVDDLFQVNGNVVVDSEVNIVEEKEVKE
jgi:hypothetical protein